LLGQALGFALANNDIIRASTIIVVGGLWALGESIVETLQQKEKGNQTNNTTSG
jgi:UDP-N-acetylglucosamine enolpyruvyl transferase